MRNRVFFLFGIALLSYDCAEKNKSQQAPPGMVYIPGGTFIMGSDAPGVLQHEGPPHEVAVDAFFMDEHEVTNAEFARFVAETGYITIAEQPVEWAQLKKDLP